MKGAGKRCQPGISRGGGRVFGGGGGVGGRERAKRRSVGGGGTGRWAHRLAGVHLGEVALQPSHSPVEAAGDGLVRVLLVRRFDNERDGRPGHHSGLHSGWRRLTGGEAEPAQQQLQEQDGNAEAQRREGRARVAARPRAPMSVPWERLPPPARPEGETGRQAGGPKPAASHTGPAQQGNAAGLHVSGKRRRRSRLPCLQPV